MDIVDAIGDQNLSMADISIEATSGTTRIYLNKEFDGPAASTEVWTDHDYVAGENEQEDELWMVEIATSPTETTDALVDGNQFVLSDGRLIVQQCHIDTADECSKSFGRLSISMSKRETFANLPRSEVVQCDERPLMS